MPNISEIDLANLNGSNGFRIDGVSANDQSGFSVSNAGDVNGDGIDDVIIGAFGVGIFDDGAAYVVFGDNSGFSASIDLSSLDGTNGFRMEGVFLEEGNAGVSVSGAGDLNGDTIDDVIVGASEALSGDGQSYVVFGSNSFGANVDLDLLNGTDGFTINGGDNNGRFGRSVSDAGDVNGDGIDDVIIGAFSAGSNVGEAHVLFGDDSGFSASLNITSLDGTNGFRIDGVDAGDFTGFSVSGAGDVNGDSIDDLIVGADGADLEGNGTESAGESYVVFGKNTGFSPVLDLSSLDGTNGFRIDGIDENDFAGFSVSDAGDVNGDGFDDLIIGAFGADLDEQGAESEGESYVVFGKNTGFSSSFDLSSLDGSNGFRIDGVEAFDDSGFSVSGAGDMNNDGFDDVIIGARFANGDLLPAEGEGVREDQVGEAYVIYGKGAGFGASFDLSTLDGDNGFLITGIDEFDNAGVSVSGAGDVNGDGFDDVIIGADGGSLESNATPDAGESYVIFGFSTGANTPPVITSSATANAPENQTFAVNVQSTDDNDSEGAGLIYSITGGDDDALFTINANTGVLSFLAPPDFEVPGDDNMDNDYEVQVTVTDSGLLTDVQDITVSVTDVNETTNAPPVITSATAVDAAENQTFAANVQSTDDNDSEGAGLTYSITGGDDDGLFGINANTGVLSFLAPPDFEAPGDDNGDNDYEVEVTVTDSGGLTDVEDFVITVTDEDDTPPPSDFTYTLVDTESDTEVGALFDGITFDPGAGTPPGERSILVDFIGDGVAGDDDGSMRLQLFDENGALVAQRLENAVPYVLFGDNAAQGFFDPSTPLVDGDYSLTVRMFSQNGGNGAVLGTETIDFTLGEVVVPDPELDLSIDLASISENGGTATGTVTRLNGGTSGNLVVNLGSSDTSEATVPAMVTILDGFDSVDFQITAQDDALVDGDNPVLISANAGGFDGSSDLIIIEDDDVPPPDPELDLSIDLASISENGGTATGTVTRLNGGTSGNLVVNLGSSDTSEATVPAMVTILDGFDSVDFQITAQDDALVDGDNPVLISANAGGFDGSSDLIIIEDDEVPPPATAGFEIGSATVKQANGSQFFTVTFEETIENARVVMGPVGFNGVQPATTRVMNVTDQGFEFQVAEWQYLDGGHNSETVFWMAMSEGDHTLADGTVVSAGRTTLEDDTAETIALSGFSNGPAVFGQVTSFNEVDTVADRISDVTSSGFTVRMQEEEDLQNGHAEETFDWIAIEYSDGSDIDVTNIAGLGSGGDTFVFDAQPDVALLADMQSFKGKDTAVLRYDDLEADSARLFVEEEKSKDSETFHLQEEVALLTADIGTYDLFA